MKYAENEHCRDAERSTKVCYCSSFENGWVFGLNYRYPTSINITLPAIIGWMQDTLEISMILSPTLPKVCSLCKDL